jgi:hypothetical protein
LIAAQTIAFQSSDVVFDHIWDVRNSLNNSPQGQAQGFADEALGYAAKRNPTDAFAAFKAPTSRRTDDSSGGLGQGMGD